MKTLLEAMKEVVEVEEAEVEVVTGRSEVETKLLTMNHERLAFNTPANKKAGVYYTLSQEQSKFLRACIKASRIILEKLEVTDELIAWYELRNSIVEEYRLNARYPSNKRNAVRPYPWKLLKCAIEGYNLSIEIPAQNESKVYADEM